MKGGGGFEEEKRRVGIRLVPISRIYCCRDIASIFDARSSTDFWQS